MCVQRYPVEKGWWMDTQKSGGHFRSLIVCNYMYILLMPQLVDAQKLSSISGIITNHTRILHLSSSGLSASTVVIRYTSSSALELEIDPLLLILPWWYHQVFIRELRNFGVFRMAHLGVG